MQATLWLVNRKLAEIMLQFAFFKVLQIFTGTTGNPLVVVVGLLGDGISIIKLATIGPVGLIMALHSWLRAWVVIG